MLVGLEAYRNSVTVIACSAEILMNQRETQHKQTKSRMQCLEIIKLKYIHSLSSKNVKTILPQVNKKQFNF